MTQLDFVQRFIFDELDARGCFVRLEETCEAIQQTHHYPKSLAVLLNQFAVAVVLLRDSIKIKGSVTIQLRTLGAIKLLMADCMADKRVRAIAEYDAEDLPIGRAINFNELGTGATLAITISPEGGERYQSIVPLENESLAACLQDYFARSEQLPTWFNFIADQDKAVGIALYALPADRVEDDNQSEENFNRLHALLNTLSKEEALTLTATQILTRLFHDESCRLFEAQLVEFGCLCSASKSLDAIKSLGKEDVALLVKEQRSDGNNQLIVDCHFCFQRYEFNFEEVENLFV